MDSLVKFCGDFAGQDQMPDDLFLDDEVHEKLNLDETCEEGRQQAEQEMARETRRPLDHKPEDSR
jgi:hypothetical protein